MDMTALTAALTYVENMGQIPGSTSLIAGHIDTDDGTRVRFRLTPDGPAEVVTIERPFDDAEPAEGPAIAPATDAEAVAEIDAIRACAAALVDLDSAAKSRAVAYLHDRYNG